MSERLNLTVEDEGWWNEDQTIYTCPIQVNEWGARIECHGTSPLNAQALAVLVKLSMDFTYETLEVGGTQP